MAIPFDANDDDQQVLEKTFAEFIALQVQCGIAFKFDMEVERGEFENLVEVAREYPGNRMFPLPDEVITACLEERICFK